MARERIDEAVKLEVAHGDITTFAVDAIVNAANSSLYGGGGVDGAIHRVGGPAILAECREVRAGRYPRGLPPGEAVATGAGDLPARWVIHTVGPVYADTEDRSGVLRACYRSSLTVATDVGARTIAFPLISAGAFGWPVDEAIRIAIDELQAGNGEVAATLVLYAQRTFELAQSIINS